MKAEASMGSIRIMGQVLAHLTGSIGRVTMLLLTLLLLLISLSPTLYLGILGCASPEFHALEA